MTFFALLSLPGSCLLASGVIEPKSGVGFVTLPTNTTVLDLSSSIKNKNGRSAIKSIACSSPNLFWMLTSKTNKKYILFIL